MIGKPLPLGKGFLGLVRYLEKGPAGEERDRVEWVESRNLPTDDPETAARLMAAYARESVRTQRPVYHLVISADPGDPVDRASMSHVADAVLRELGLSEHQVLIIAHNDTDHPHMHLVVNRVHPETHRAWENGWDWPKIEKALRAEEVALGWRIVPGKHAPVPGREPPAPALVRGDPAFLRMVQERAGPVLERARSWGEVQQGLAPAGLSLRVKGGGLSIHDGRQEVKASDVGSAFSRGKLEQRFGKWSARGSDPVREPGPVLSGNAAPAPEPEAAPEPDPPVARVQRAEPPQPVPPLPIQPQRPVRRPPARVMAPVPEPQPEPVPLYLRPLVEVIREGGAVEAKAHQLDRIIEQAAKAQANADDLAERAERARSRVEALRDAVRPVYVDPGTAVSRMREFRRTHTQYELHNALGSTPEDFGELKARTVYPLWGLGVVPRRDYSEAREKAPGIAAALESATFALSRRPKAGEAEAAREAADKLRQGGREAGRERLKLPQSYTYETEATTHMRSLASMLGPDELARQLRPLLERDPHALELARRVLSRVEAAFRQRHRERGRDNGGLDF
jgi:hypothetical protein